MASHAFGSMMLLGQAVDDPLAPIVSLQRWMASQTLTSPTSDPGFVGLGIWLSGLALWLVVLMIVQGPSRALRQAMDLAGHVRLIARGIERLRSSARMGMSVLGATVIGWTVYELIRYRSPLWQTALEVVTRRKGVGQLSIEQGMFAAMTPMRDVLALGDSMILLMPACVYAASRLLDGWSSSATRRDGVAGQDLGWGVVSLVLILIYTFFRIAQVISGEELPLSGLLFIEPVVLPLLMVLADGFILAWILVELRAADSRTDSLQSGVLEALKLAPIGAVACVAAMPARAVAMVGCLLLPYAGTGMLGRVLASLLMGWGLAILQCAMALGVVLVGAVTWSDSRLSRLGHEAWLLLRRSGGRVWGLVVIGGLAACAVSFLSYLVILSLPRQPWVLNAADGYAHFATLPIGLTMAACLVELAFRVEASDALLGKSEVLRQEEERVALTL